MSQFERSVDQGMCPYQSSAESRNPDQPFGEGAVAASYLFEELYRQNVLSSDFFLNEKKFLNGI